MILALFVIISIWSDDIFIDNFEVKNETFIIPFPIEVNSSHLIIRVMLQACC